MVVMDIMKEMVNMAIEEEILEIDNEQFPIVGKEYWVLEYLFSEDYDGNYSGEDIYFDTLDEALEQAEDFWSDLTNYDKQFCEFCFVGKHKVISIEENVFKTTDWLEIAKCYKGHITI